MKPVVYYLPGMVRKIDEAQRMKVDAVSGATFSSKAIIGNVEQGLAFAAKNAHEKRYLGANKS